MCLGWATVPAVGAAVRLGLGEQSLRAPAGACQCALGLAGSGPALRGSKVSTGPEAWHLLHPAPPPPHRSLPETLLQLCFPEGSREPRKDAPWGSGLGESLLEERLYKAIVGNLPGAGPLLLACIRSWRLAASFGLDWQKGPAVGHSGSELAGHDVSG